MTSDLTISNWEQGANNIAARDRLPAGTYRQAINLDPTAGGKLEMRCGFERVYQGADVRGAFGIGEQVVIADGDTLKAYDTATGSVTELAAINSAGGVSGVEMNGQLFLGTPNESYRLQGGVLKPWAIAEPVFTVTTVAGSLPAGIYKVAVTAIGVDGEESGVVPQIIRLNGLQALRVSSTDPRDLNLYASPCDAETLYSQGRLRAATTIGVVADDAATLTTAFMVPMPYCEELVAFRGVLIGRIGREVYATNPFQPHLVDPARGFFQYGTDVTMLAKTDGGIYIGADKTWFMTNPQTDQPIQAVVLDFGAVKGASITLPDGRAAWFTRYGQAIGDTAGGVSLPNRSNYAPDTATSGAAGLLEHNSNQMVVTTMRGQTKANRLAAGDFCDVEITDER